MSGEDIILKSAELRGRRNYDAAIALIEANIGAIDDEIKLTAWLEAFHAAKEKGDQALAKKYALLVAAEDPKIPSIQNYL